METQRFYPTLNGTSGKTFERTHAWLRFQADLRPGACQGFPGPKYSADSL